MKPFFILSLKSPEVNRMCKTCTSCRHAYEDLVNDNTTYVVITKEGHIFCELNQFMNEFDGLEDEDLQEMIENLASQSYDSMAAIKEAQELDKKLRIELKRREIEGESTGSNEESLGKQLFG